MQIRIICSSATLILGLATTPANAMVMPARIAIVDSAVVKVAEGCGPGWWRSPDGRCHPLPAGHEDWACPPGYHLGQFGGSCWLNCPPGYHVGRFGGRCWRN
jgi:hypothetical protein